MDLQRRIVTPSPPLARTRPLYFWTSSSSASSTSAVFCVPVTSAMRSSFSYSTFDTDVENRVRGLFRDILPLLPENLRVRVRLYIITVQNLHTKIIPSSRGKDNADAKKSSTGLFVGLDFYAYGRTIVGLWSGDCRAFPEIRWSQLSCLRACARQWRAARCRARCPRAWRILLGCD